MAWMGCGASDREPATLASPVDVSTASDQEAGGLAVHVVAHEDAGPERAPLGLEGCDHDALTPLVVDSAGGLAGALVWVPVDHDGDAEPADIHIKTCTLEPQVLAVGDGEVVRLTNDDTLAHVCVAVPLDGTQGVPIQVAPGATIDLTLPDGHLLAIHCARGADGDPGAGTTALVARHGRTAVTDASGRAHLDALEASDHDVVVAHPLLGHRQAVVAVSPGRDSLLVVSFRGR